ncbi:MAG TPA: hypothetical protein VFT43_05530, partial [Candidatus Polarisedimenticolia bacterium]|nr:hypothetical protein [Candidatus Polarisedimenticolia bacterium]
RIVKVSSPLDHDVTRGNLCIKGRFGWQSVQAREATPPGEPGDDRERGRREPQPSRASSGAKS